MLVNRDLTDFNFQTSMKNKSRADLISCVISDGELLYNELMLNPPSLFMTTKQIIDEISHISGDEANKKHILNLLKRDPTVQDVRSQHVDGNLRLWELNDTDNLATEHKNMEYKK